MYYVLKFSSRSDVWGITARGRNDTVDLLKFVCCNVKGIGANANSPLEKLCNWRALIEGHVMEVHSTRVQWPAPLQGPHLLIRGSPLPGKYAAVCMNIFTSSPTQTLQGRHCGLRFLFYFFSSRAARCFQEPWREGEGGSNSERGRLLCKIPCTQAGVWSCPHRISSRSELLSYRLPHL